MPTETSRVIWQWRGGSDAAPRSVACRAYRRRGLTQGGVGLAAATALHLLGLPLLGGIALAVSLGVSAAALLSPDRAYAWIGRLLEGMGLWVGRGLTWLLLVPLYYGFFFPFRLVSRLGRRDLLQRRPDPGARTYWRGRVDERAPQESYRRLF